MAWIHTSRPMTEVRYLILHRPTIFVFVNHNWIRLLMKYVHRNLMSSETNRTILTFFTVIGMRQNTTVFKYEKSFITDCFKSISIFRVVVDSFCFDLIGPIQKDSAVLNHLPAHFCNRTFFRSFKRSHCFSFFLFFSHKLCRGLASFTNADCPSKLTSKRGMSVQSVAVRTVDYGLSIQPF